MFKKKNSMLEVPPEIPKLKKPFYKKWWFWVIIVVVFFGAIGSLGDSDTTEIKEETVAKDTTTQETNNETVEEEVVSTEPEETVSTESEVPIEYSNALKKAVIYANTLYLSKAALYEQLTSEYGEQFSPEAAQYAVDNVAADWNYNALQKAKVYLNDLAMSPNAIYDQLVSEYGEQFTPEEAQYAIDNLGV